MKYRVLNAIKTNPYIATLELEKRFRSLSHPKLGAILSDLERDGHIKSGYRNHKTGNSWGVS